MTRILWAAGWALAAANAFSATINHSHIAAVSTMPATYSAQIATQKWFFTHASVGGNIVDGMYALYASNPSRYPLRIYNWPGADPEYHGGVGTAGTEGGWDYRAETAPGTTTPGYIYECLRGNPYWPNKLVCFSNSLYRSGWGSNKVQFVMNKFCWIDPDASPTDYCQSMTNLEQRFTNVVFVYTTMPLTGLQDDENNVRNTYNRAIRVFCEANGKLLFDVADIQAWTPGNVQQTYVSGGQTNQRMYTGYAVNPSADDWHLNSSGRQRLAMGWYAVALTAINTNVTQYFTFRAMALTNSVVLRWPNPIHCGMLSSNVHVRYSTNDYPAATNAGTAVYTGDALTCTHDSLVPGLTYYYTIWVSDDGIHYVMPP